MRSATRNVTVSEMNFRAGACAVFVAVGCGARTELGVGRSDAAASVPNPPDFVWYKLDETSGDIAHDSSSHHFDMKVSGASWGDGAFFDGATCGSATVGPEFREPPISITAWLTPSSRSDQTTNEYALGPFPPDALSGDAPSIGGYGLGADVWTDGSGGASVALETGANAAIAFHTLDANVADAKRTFVALVVDATHALVYVDGAELATLTANVPPPVPKPLLHLGCHNDDTGYGTKRFFHGRMRDVRVYERALSASDVAALYASGPV